jgi:uncharacterized protein YecE (DUF72 family)
LRYYATEFPDLVEVNSTYYALPSERNSILWVQRTPDDLIFDVKMYSLITQHPTQPKSLPGDLYAELRQEVRSAKQVCCNHVPAEIAAEVLDRFVAALRPLHEAGKLGAVLLQFPTPRRRSGGHGEPHKSTGCAKREGPVGAADLETR